MRSDRSNKWNQQPLQQLRVSKRKSRLLQLHPSSPSSSPVLAPIPVQFAQWSLFFGSLREYGPSSSRSRSALILMRTFSTLSASRRTHRRLCRVSQLPSIRSNCSAGRAHRSWQRKGHSSLKRCGQQFRFLSHGCHRSSFWPAGLVILVSDEARRCVPGRWEVLSSVPRRTSLKVAKWRSSIGSGN